MALARYFGFSAFTQNLQVINKFLLFTLPAFFSFFLSLLLFFFLVLFSPSSASSFACLVSLFQEFFAFWLLRHLYDLLLLLCLWLGLQWSHKFRITRTEKFDEVFSVVFYSAKWAHYVEGPLQRLSICCRCCCCWIRQIRKAYKSQEINLMWVLKVEAEVGHNGEA